MTVTGGSATGIGIALDTENGRLYWTERSNNRISRAALDGSSPEEIVPDVDQPAGIASTP